jgi:REP element-mobilizing transposase RayT
MPAPHSSGKMPAISNFQPFNPYEEIEATRRRLPHWQQEGTAYFITFRLADSIPQEKLAQWEAERKQWLATHPQPWDETAVAEYSKLFSERRQQWLDNGYGRCLLKLPDVAEIVRSALLHFDGQRYLLDEFVLMPNHVHIIVKLLPDHDLSSVLHSWKSFTAKEINKAIEGTGTIWQDESYDHIVRSDSQLEFYRNYIRENPAKAGLKQIKSQSGIGIPQESGAGVPPAIEEREEAGRQESGAGVPPAIAEREEAGKMPAPHSSQCGAGVPPAIAERKEAGKMPAPHSSQCGAGVPPAIAGREETGKMPAPRSSQCGVGVPPAIAGREEAGREKCGVGVPPAIAGREEAGKMPAPRSSQCGVGVPPAISSGEEAGKMPAPRSSQCGVGVPPAISSGEEAGKMPAPRSSQCGVGVPPAISSGEEAGKMPAPRSSGRMPAISNFQPFNPYEEIEATHRRLPHWQQEGTAYFITFRLADSIPQEKLTQWEAERKQWLATHPQPWDETAIAEYSKLFSERRQQWLDNGYGSCLLKLPDVAEIVRSALLHFDGQRYLLDEFVLMPNHVHIIVKLLPGHDLSSVLHSWKSFTAKEINKAIKGTGTIWQDESYDHIVRSDSQLKFYRKYIRENPAKAGLKQIKSQSGAGTPQECGECVLECGVIGPLAI